MNKKLLEFARSANKECLRPVERIDPRFLTHFAKQVVNECLNQMKETGQNEEELKKRIEKHFEIIFKD